ncbi:hypothetical protein M2373_004397 [Chryseobacterium sp. JUb7]|nr:hypothetical protein [Chryseobacterium sp. JUb7]
MNCQFCRGSQIVNENEVVKLIMKFDAGLVEDFSNEGENEAMKLMMKRSFADGFECRSRKLTMK